MKDVLLSRVRAPGPDAAELVRLAAVFGLWVADDAACTRRRGLPPDRYAAAVREAVDVGVLVVEGADYAFRHSLMCEAVLSQLLPIERRMLHERAARALAGDAGDDVVTAVAVSLHWAAAGMPGRGGRVEPARGAQGPAAQRLRRGLGHYQRALRVRPARAARTRTDLDLVLEAAGTARLAGDPAAAAALLEEALRADRPTGAERAPAPWSGWAASSGRPG